MAVTQPQSQPQPQSHAARSIAEAIDRMADELRTLGISNSQLRRWAKRRSPCRTSTWCRRGRRRAEAQHLAWPPVRSPLRAYPIADLNRMWILADMYRDQLPFIRRAPPHDHRRPKEPCADGDGQPFDPLRPDQLTPKVRLEAPNPRRRSSPTCSSTWSSRSTSRRRWWCRRMSSWIRGCANVFVERGTGGLRAAAGRDGVAHRRRRRGDERAHARRAIMISGTFFVDSRAA